MKAKTCKCSFFPLPPFSRATCKAVLSLAFAAPEQPPVPWVCGCTRHRAAIAGVGHSLALDYDHSQAACASLFLSASDPAAVERTYWKHITYNSPIYGADISGSITDPDCDVWNVNGLGASLQYLRAPPHLLPVCSSSHRRPPMHVQTWPSPRPTSMYPSSHGNPTVTHPSSSHPAIWPRLYLLSVLSYSPPCRHQYRYHGPDPPCPFIYLPLPSPNTHIHTVSRIFLRRALFAVLASISGTCLDMIGEELGAKIEGVNTAYLYFGMWKASSVSPMFTFLRLPPRS